MDIVPYDSRVGSIMCGMVCSRPNLAHAIHIVKRFRADSGQAHWEALKQVLRYVNGSLESGLKYQKVAQGGDAIMGYVDAKYVEHVDTMSDLFSAQPDVSLACSFES